MPAANLNKKSVKSSSPKRLLTWQKILIVVIVLVVLLLIGWYFANKALKAPEKVGDAFITDMQQNNPQAAFALYPANTNGQVTEAALAKAFNNYVSHIQGSVSVDGGLRFFGSQGKSVIIYGLSNNGHTTYVKVLLADYGSQGWRVTNFQGFGTKPSLSYSVSQ